MVANDKSFARLFRTWFVEQPGNEELARQLTALSPQAWNAGDSGDRDALLRFIYLRKDSSLFHYLIEALAEEERGLDLQAVGYIGSLAAEGSRFPSESRTAITEFGDEHPDLQSLVEHVLTLIKDNDTDGPRRNHGG